MQCPRCKKPLVEATLEGAAVQRCPGCSGLWVRRSEYLAAAERSDVDAGWLAFELWRDAERFRGAAGALACPGCGKPMVRLTYGDRDVSVDVCSTCPAVWLDAEELERSVHALRKELGRRSIPKLVEAALEEAGEILHRRGALGAEWHHAARVARLLEQRLLADHPRLQQLLVSLQGGGGFP